MHQKRERLASLIEGAVLLLGCAVLLTGVWASARQRVLSEKVVRLHVLAASDAPADQETKLQVRDAVLTLVEPCLAEVSDAREAEARLYDLLPELQTLAESVSGQSAEVRLSREAYPTREYEGFSLPAGVYSSLRVVLGEGQGRNWWCVVYPPLCSAGLSEIAETALTEDEVKLITECDRGFEVRFRIVEWWGKLI